MTKKYKFRLSETNWIEFTEKELNNFKNVNFIDDNSTDKVIPIKRAFDNQTYYMIVPLEMIELQKD